MRSLVVRALASLLFAGMLVGCSSASPSVAPPSVSPSLDRAVTVTTTACGHASRTSGAGVIIGDGRVLAAAHVVIGAGSISVEAVGGGAPLPATVVRLDPRADLAVLDVAGLSGEPVELSSAETGDRLTVVGGGPSGTFEATITRRVEVRIEEVRSTTRSSRRGYEVDRRVALGDSGAGAFDDRGRLVAVIYGRTQSDTGLSFAVRHEEIAEVLADIDSEWSCDPTQHRIVTNPNAR